jgi:polyvinyl alcohol dehydrogenase (cytochrome)
MIAVDKNTGDRAWVKQVDNHPSSIITQSATVFQNRIFVGVASVEELHAAIIPGYECCTFRGSMLALDAQTGDILWRTYTTADGFSGNAIWGSAPSVDRNRRQVYVATGNNYSGPQSFIDCVGAAGDDAAAQRECLDPYPDNHFDSVVAYDIDTGEVNWVNTVIPFDVWTIQCVFEFPSCPDPEGPDFDFGQAPMLYTARYGNTQRDLVGVGQKSGVFWALDADDGGVVWSTQIDPGGLAGGLIWGSAYDGERIYTSSANSGYQPWVLLDGSVTYGGFYSALDPATGEILWQTANPAGYHTAGGAVTVANGVVYACSQDPDGHMYALDASTGSVEWDFVSGGSCNGGAAVVGGQVFWGSGYAGFGPPNTSNNLFYAFERP